MSIGASRSQQLGEDLGGVAEQADRQRPLGVARLDRQREGVVDVGGLDVEVAVVDAAVDAGLVAVHADRHALVHRHRQRLRAAHAADACGEGDGAGQGVRRTSSSRPHRRSRRCPAGCPACRCRSTSPPSSARTSSGPAASSLRNCSQFAQSPTRLELAISTRGAHTWVRNTPTGLPDCTSMVSSFSRSRSVAHDRVERLPAAGGATGAAVDHEVLGVLGDLGVEVVHQHPQRGFLLPALAGDVGAARGADRVRLGYRSHGLQHT